MIERVKLRLQDEDVGSRVLLFKGCLAFRNSRSLRARDIFPTLHLLAAVQKAKLAALRSADSSNSRFALGQLPLRALCVRGQGAPEKSP
jgi:hypothetical protein